MKKKRQEYSFKEGSRDSRGNRANLKMAIGGRPRSFREYTWAIALAWADDSDPTCEFRQLLDRVVLPEMRDAAQSGEGAAFKRLAECVSSVAESGKRKWVDPLVARMINWHGGLHDAPFNIERFRNETNAAEDRMTILLRVRALGLKVKSGRPKKAEN